MNGVGLIGISFLAVAISIFSLDPSQNGDVRLGLTTAFVIAGATALIADVWLNRTMAKQAGAEKAAGLALEAD